MGVRIVVVDDERDFLDTVRRGLFTAGFRDVCLKTSPREVAALIEHGEPFDIALIDVTMPEMSGVELLGRIKTHTPNTECIMITAINEAGVAVECIRKGAYDYMVKPVSRDDLILRIKHAQERKRLLDVLDVTKKDASPTLVHTEAFSRIITQSPAVLKILKEAELHAASDVPVLITGESGTGKELLARAIHLASPRAKSPFTPVNMASLSPTLFDSEFFGHTRGAFTGAERDRAGYLEHSNGGTLFLDEIGSLPLDLQGKLLRVLQEGEFLKLGTSTLHKADVRIVAATNEDLERQVSKELFRKDLYYRLRVAWLQLPPLRERKDDIPLLISGFLKEFTGGPHDRGIDEDALSLLMHYDFPGNIRELKSIIKASLNLAKGSPITARFLPAHLQSQEASRYECRLDPEVIVPLSEVEKSHIISAYELTGRNKSHTSRALGIGMNTLRRKLESYGIE